MEVICGKKSIYIVFSRTDTRMGRFIRVITGYTYNHVSIAMDSSLERMYSFSRFHKGAAFFGGFVEESLLRYFYKKKHQRKKKKPKIKVLEIEVERSVYWELVNELAEFKRKKEVYIYNTYGAILSIFRKRIPPKDTFTCVDFMAYLMIRANVFDQQCGNEIFVLKELYLQLQKLEKDEFMVKDIYPVSEGWRNDPYMINRGYWQNWMDNIRHFRRLRKRYLENS